MELGEELSRVRSLSNEALLLGLSHSLRTSRRAVAEVVAHLGEVEERRLHLLGGYASMFAYCVQRLGMSEDEAYRRLEVARLVRRFPSLFERLEAGHISLSVVALLKARLTDANREALLAAVSGKTVEQARVVLAAWFPQPDVLPLIRKLPAGAAPLADAARAAEPARTAPLAPAALASPTPAPQPQTAAPVPVPAPARRSCRPRSIEPLSPGRYKVQLTASATLKGKLELARDLLRHAIPSGDLACIIERALDVLIERTMKRRFARTSAPHAARDDANTPGPRTAHAQPAPTASASRPARSTALAPRHIPNAVRREVHDRDGIRCAWRGPDGTRCDSRAWLEHDHVVPHAHGGGSDATNIRPFCRAHNRLAAEQVFGRDTIARIIARRHERRAGACQQVVPSTNQLTSRVAVQPP
jgi:hypothetical protein